MVASEDNDLVNFNLGELAGQPKRTIPRHNNASLVGSQGGLKNLTINLNTNVVASAQSQQQNFVSLSDY